MIKDKFNNSCDPFFLQISPILRIKNEILEITQTPLNPFPSSLKRHPKQVIKLLSFPRHPNIA